jgi:hypothetical protein
MNLRDPTRSAGIRRQGRALVKRKMFELGRELHQTVQQHDLIGLRARDDVPKPLMLWGEQPEYKLARGAAVVGGIVRQHIADPPEWLTPVVERSVRRGLEQVAQELKEAVDLLDASEVTAFQAAWVSNEVEGLAAETHRRGTRHIARAIEVKQSPEVLMREIRWTLQKITQRMILLVNTAVVRSVNAGKLFGYEQNGITQVGIDAEWLASQQVHDHALHDAKRKTKKKTVKRRGKLKPLLDLELVHVLTAGDDVVCDECRDIAADGPYEIDLARDLIPAHINCRCAFVPFGDKRYAALEEYDDD